MSAARQAFDRNKTDIDRLLAIHAKIAGKGRGRKHGVEVLNRSAIVFITASWEAFVEDLAVEAFDFLLSATKSADKIPTKVRATAIERLLLDKNKLCAWDLADNGWRDVLRREVRDPLVAKFNTPKSENVNELFRRLIGLKRTADSWSWHRTDAASAAKKLDWYIQARGAIAHGTQRERVYKSWTFDYLALVEMLVEKTEDRVGSHLRSLVGKRPW